MKMNEYKTMFTRIECANTRHDDIDLLYGLVEKATPMKVDVSPERCEFVEIKCYSCPSCNNYVGSDYRFCPYCGQALDWGDEK